MIKWLECEENDHPSDLDVWHMQKSEYGFKELEDWIGNGGTLDKAVKKNVEKEKGKGKAVEESDEGEKEFEKMEIEERGEGNKKGKASGSKAKKTHKKQ